MLRAGDVVLVDFVGATGVKRRPAVVVSTDTYHAHRPDLVVCLLTTQLAAAVTPIGPGSGAEGAREMWQETPVTGRNLLPNEGPISTAEARRNAMPAATLDEIQRLADELSPLDQVRLLEHLLPRIARVVALAQPATPVAPPGSLRAWEEFFRLGEQLAAQDTLGTGTLTAAVLSMRR